MTTSYTNNYGLAMPEQGAGEELLTPWDAEVNGNFVALDSLIKTNADAIVAKENVANKSTDGTLAANSDVKYPSQKAVKTYVDMAPPAAHTHPESDVTGLVSDLAGKAPLVHTHSESDVTGLVTDLAGKAPLVHTHAQSDVTGLTAALAGKAPTVHTHVESDVTNLVTDLAAKAPLDSPTFTNTPAAPTATVDTTTTQLATTAFVVNQASAVTPQPPGTAAIGTSKRYARADHVHAASSGSSLLIDPSSYVWFYDDFLSGKNVAAAGNFPTGGMNIGWQLALGGSGTAVVTTTPASGTAGYALLTTGATSGNFSQLFCGGASSSSICPLSDKTFELKFRMRISTNANITCYVGFSDGSNNNRIAISFDTGASDTTWQAHCISGGTPTKSVITGAPLDTSVHNFRIRSTVAGTVLFSVDGGTEISINTNVPTAVVGPIISIVTNTTAAIAINIDYYWGWIAISR